MFIIIRPGLRGMSAGSAAAPVSASGGWRTGPNQPRPPAFPSSGENPSVGLKPPLSPQTDGPGDVGGHQLPHHNSSHNHRERTMMTRTPTDLALVPVHTHWHSVFCVGQFQLSLSSICSQYNHIKRVRGHRAHWNMAPCWSDLLRSLGHNDNGENVSHC